MAARGIATRKYAEFQRSGKFRKVLCYGHGLGTVGVLACMFLLCSLFLDMRTYYHTSKRVHLQPELRSGSHSAPNPSVVTSPQTDEVPAITELNSKGLQGLVTNDSSHESRSVEFPSQEDPETKLAPDELQAEIQAQEEPQILSMPGKDRKKLAGCDLQHGQWVYDESYPLYRSRNCPFVDTSFRCEENGRPDQDFMKYRWRPHDCDLPKFEAKVMLERLRNKRLLFVGDSLGRNQWESMLCMLAEAVHNKSRIYEVGGRPIDKTMGELVFMFEDYNCTVEYYRDPFLIPQVRPPPGLPPNVTSVLKIDEVSWSAKFWHGADTIVFNSGHWWSWEKIGRGGGRFYKREKLTEDSNEDAFKTAVSTWAWWIERNLDRSTQVFFRSFASTHFRGGAWNNGGHCHEETKPLTDEEVKKEQPTPWTNKHIKSAIARHIRRKRKAVDFMDVTTLTDYRADAHAGLYGKDVKIHGLPPKSRQDCSHFCLPGVPDTWNELLFASLLAKGQGVWGTTRAH